ncbi:MAG: ferrous iron transport protein A, partial [Candidatus Omnitrophica bacterium]|nr:ferrous iron transport protein A [Candidatus Omnitrophota bacterium]
DVGCGMCVRITHLTGDPDLCRRLREMGLCESESIFKVSQHGALICDVKNSRIALSKHIAQNIKVEYI